MSPYRAREKAQIANKDRFLAVYSEKEPSLLVFTEKGIPTSTMKGLFSNNYTIRPNKSILKTNKKK